MYSIISKLYQVDTTPQINDINSVNAHPHELSLSNQNSQKNYNEQNNARVYTYVIPKKKKHPEQLRMHFLMKIENKIIYDSVSNMKRRYCYSYSMFD